VLHIAAELQMQVWQDVRFILMDEYWQTTGKRLSGIIPGCFTVFYKIKRASETRLALWAIVPH
jgi:hypothetical protein